jgi:hypothetical protein
MATQFQTRQLKDGELTQAKLDGGVFYSTTTSIDDTDSPYTVLDTDDILLVDSSTAAVSIFIPALANHPDGRVLTIKDAGGLAGTNMISISMAGSEGSFMVGWEPSQADLVDGRLLRGLSSDGASVTLLKTSTQWVHLDSVGTISSD